jgi:hypothetical protein
MRAADLGYFGYGFLLVLAAWFLAGSVPMLAVRVATLRKLCMDARPGGVSAVPFFAP